MSKKKSVLLLISVLLGIVLITVSIVVKSSNSNNLRQKYPIIKASEYYFDIPEFDFEDSVRYAPNIAEIEVVEKLPNYTVHVEDTEANISTTLTFHQYKVKVISDIAETEFEVESDGTITIAYSSVFKSSYPRFSDGMNAICSIEAAAGVHAGKYLLYDKTFYYVEQNVALAAYEGDTSPASVSCDKTELIKQIKSIRKKYEKIK